MTQNNEDIMPVCHVCGKEYDVGCHGVQGEEVVSTYWCLTHWNEFKMRRYKTKKVKHENN